MQVAYRFKLSLKRHQQETILRWQPMMRSFYNYALKDRIDSYYQVHTLGNYCDLRTRAQISPLTCSVNKSASIGYPWREDNPSKRRNKNQNFNPRRTTYEMQSSSIKELRESRKWYREIPFDVLQQSLGHLNTAFNNFFTGHADFPRFKRLGQANRFEFKPGTVSIQGNRITLPGLGTMKFFPLVRLEKIGSSEQRLSQ